MASVLSCCRYNVKVSVVDVDGKPTVTFQGDIKEGAINVDKHFGMIVFSLEDPALRFVKTPIEWANDNALVVSRDSDTQITVFDLNNVPQGGNSVTFGFFVSLVKGGDILSSGDPQIVNHDPTLPQPDEAGPRIVINRHGEVSAPLPS
jgi:hypothetical protein